MMRTQMLYRTRSAVLFALIVAILPLANALCAEPVTSSGDASKTNSVVRSYGPETGYRTEVTSNTTGTLGSEDQQQVAILTAHVFQHIVHAQRALEADKTSDAQQEIVNGRNAIKAIRSLLPTTTVHTQTRSPNGKVIYEATRTVQADRVPLFEGMSSTKTLSPIVAAKQDAVEIKGLRLVGSETITTEAFADLDYVESQLDRASKALNDNEAGAAMKALTLCQVRG